jgi:hypothetical protein
MLVEFLRGLREKGEVAVSREFDLAEGPQLEISIVELDREARLNLAGVPPTVDLPAAVWGARMLYRGCRLLVCRDLAEAEVRQSLGTKYPATRGPAVDYSVDLVLQCLPDLYRMARRLSVKDPLVEELLRLGREWPLSSVGMTDVGSVNVDSFIDHPCLRQLYVDRILARGDAERLDDPRVMAAAQESVGAFTELSPVLEEKRRLT